MSKRQFDLIADKIAEYKTTYAELEYLDDEVLFTILCMKYFYFPEKSTSPVQMLDYLVGIQNERRNFAIFNDPESDNGDVVVLYAHYAPNNDVKRKDLHGILESVLETIEDLSDYQFNNYNEQLANAYQNAVEQKQDAGSIRICFFTSASATRDTKRSINAAGMKSATKRRREVEFSFQDDIQAEIEAVEHSGVWVEKDQLTLDEPDNCLEYQDSVIVNISAKSLKALRDKWGNSILALNLRYYVRKKDVDSGIDATITNAPDSFWYRNNGIIIVCSDYELDGKVVRLKNFSIINGGQTTYRIGRVKFDEDFYLQCKIIKATGDTLQEQDAFITEVAKATNSQKPIRQADLEANTPEQARIAQTLRNYNVQYITKRGEAVDKAKFPEPYQSTKVDEFGKLSLAGCLQMPGSARSNPKKMYNEENRFSIFGGEAKVGVVVDLLKILHYYDVYLKSEEFKKLPIEIVQVLKNGKLYVVAAIVLFFKLYHNVLDYKNDVEPLLNNTDKLKRNLRKMGDLNEIIVNKCDDEKQHFFYLFRRIGKKLAASFRDAKKAAEAITEANFLKQDENYYKWILPQLYDEYIEEEDSKTYAKVKLLATKRE